MRISFTFEPMKTLIHSSSISFPLLSANSDQKGLLLKMESFKPMGLNTGECFLDLELRDPAPNSAAQAEIWVCALPRSQYLWKIMHVFMRSYSSILGIIALVFHSDMTLTSCPLPTTPPKKCYKVLKLLKKIQSGPLSLDHIYCTDENFCFGWHLAFISLFFFRLLSRNIMGCLPVTLLK